MSGEQAAVAEALAAAFSGDEFEENAAAAAGEGEWSWFRWLALTTVEGVTATPARLSDEERDALAESLRHQWEGGRHRFMTWGDLSERDKDRWREEVDILPFAAILAARGVQPTPPTPPAQAEAVAAVIAAIEATYPPYNYELRYDGSEDPTAAAYVDAFREVDNVLDQFRAPTAADQVAAMKDVAKHGAQVAAEGRRE